MSTAVALCLLALADAGFSGFRAAAGRNPAVAKRRYYRAAVVRGVVTGGAALAVIGSAIGIIIATAADPGARYASYVARGGVMLSIYVPFASVVAGGFALYAVRSIDVRSVLSALIFGPVTLLRPVVIVAGAVAAGWGAGLAIGAPALIAALLMIGLEAVLSRRYRRWFDPGANDPRAHSAIVTVPSARRRR